MSETTARAEWMGLLARARPERLEQLWRDLSPTPEYGFLRRPEQGLAMVRGRAGGTGRPFNMGEMVITRCSVQLADGTVGHAYVAGRSARKAEIAAVFDALLQRSSEPEADAAYVLAPLRTAEDERRRSLKAKAAATKVDFFTLVRGKSE